MVYRKTDALTTKNNQPINWPQQTNETSTLTHSSTICFLIRHLYSNSHLKRDCYKWSQMDMVFHLIRNKLEYTDRNIQHIIHIFRTLVKRATIRFFVLLPILLGHLWNVSIFNNNKEFAISNENEQRKLNIQIVDISLSLYQLKTPINWFDSIRMVILRLKVATVIRMWWMHNHFTHAHFIINKSRVCITKRR